MQQVTNFQATIKGACDPVVAVGTVYGVVCIVRRQFNADHVLYTQINADGTVSPLSGPALVGTDKDETTGEPRSTCLSCATDYLKFGNGVLTGDGCLIIPGPSCGSNAQTIVKTMLCGRPGAPFVLIHTAFPFAGHARTLRMCLTPADAGCYIVANAGADHPVEFVVSGWDGRTCLAKFPPIPQKFSECLPIFGPNKRLFVCGSQIGGCGFRFWDKRLFLLTHLPNRYMKEHGTLVQLNEATRKWIIVPNATRWVRCDSSMCVYGNLILIYNNNRGSAYANCTVVAYDTVADEFSHFATLCNTRTNGGYCIAVLFNNCMAAVGNGETELFRISDYHIQRAAPWRPHHAANFSKAFNARLWLLASIFVRTNILNTDCTEVIFEMIAAQLTPSAEATPIQTTV